jgi:3'-phosphoadenosine 5'-phosphosulfate sulfotransferase (PAPS reductase)/FAD synthetase
MIEKNREKKLVIISLGAGVQSSTMALMAAKGELPRPDCAIFADTGYEPKSIYLYLDYLTSILPYPVHIVRKGNIKDDMLN